MFIELSPRTEVMPCVCLRDDMLKGVFIYFSRSLVTRATLRRTCQPSRYVDFNQRVDVFKWLVGCCWRQTICVHTIHITNILRTDNNLYVT